MKLWLNPNAISVSSDILQLIGRIDEFKGAWKAYGNLPPERLTTLKRIATIESVGSSTRIEGGTLSDAQVASVMANMSVTSFTSRDEEEVAGYAYVMNEIFASWQEMDISENLVKQLHKDLMRFSSKDIRHRGEYKKMENRVAAFDAKGSQIGIVFETATAFETPFLMRELVEWVANEYKEKIHHPLIVIALFVVNFLAIHPFEDGNGRLSRILTNLLLLKAGYTYIPYSSLENIIESNKQNYYLCLRMTQKTLASEDFQWKPWTQFFLETLNSQIKRLEKKLDHEKLLAPIPKLSLRIIEYTQQHGRSTMKELEQELRISRNTIRWHLKELVENNKLKQQGRKKGTFYSIE